MGGKNSAFSVAAEVRDRMCIAQESPRQKRGVVWREERGAYANSSGGSGGGCENGKRAGGSSCFCGL